MIEELKEEQASSYVLGALSPEESRAFEVLLLSDPELQQLVAEFRGVTDSLAAAVPRVRPSAELKQRIMARLDVRNRAIRSVDRPERPMDRDGFPFWLPWALAAFLAVMCIALLTQGQAARHLLTSKANQLRSELAASQAQIAELKSRDYLSQQRVALFRSLLESSPKAAAALIWDNDRQEGVLVVVNLAPLSPDRDYQLWVIDKQNNPIDAGVFPVDEEGQARVQFKPKARVPAADKFAVTVEDKGGKPKPEGKMVLLGS